jgi:hypothetical protein
MRPLSLLEGINPAIKLIEPPARNGLFGKRRALLENMDRHSDAMASHCDVNKPAPAGVVGNLVDKLFGITGHWSPRTKAIRPAKLAQSYIARSLTQVSAEFPFLRVAAGLPTLPAANPLVLS